MQLQLELWFLALLLNGSTLILRHATHKYMTVFADLMESNDRLNISKEHELIQLEQTPCNAM